MASVQQGAVEFSDKQKASIAEALKEAQNHLENNNAKASQDNLALVTGIVGKDLRRRLILGETHTWTGRFVAGPSEIRIGLDEFVHQGATTQGGLQVVVGSKGAVVYNTLDKMDPALGYLLAWDKPDDVNGPNKVYVEAGNAIRFAKIDWSKIEKKLDASSSESSYKDSETGAAAGAALSSYGGNLALLGATFDDHVEK